MKEKTLRINNLDKLSHSKHREITPNWKVIKTFHRNEFGPKITQYEIYLERLGVTPPCVLEINIIPMVKIGLDTDKWGTPFGSSTKWVEINTTYYVNTQTTSTQNTYNVDMSVIKDIESFKECIREIIPILSK